MDSQVEYSHSEIMVVITALMLVMLLAALDQTIVSTALPRIATDLHGLNKISWVATAYLLTSAITTPIYGKISDQLGRKKIFQTAIIIFLIGSVLCGISQNMNELVLARGLQGIGAGGLMSLVLAIVGDIIPPRQRGKYMGYFMSVFGVSSVIGPLLGGFLTDSLSWRWVFFVNIPLGAIALTAVATRLHLPVYKEDHNIDYTGAALLSVGSVCLLLATVWGGTNYAWASTQIIGLLIAGVVLAVSFVLWERRAKEPIIPLHLFKNDIFTVSVLLSLLSGIAMFAAILYIPVYQQTVRGFSPTKSGLLMLPLVLGLLVAGITSGRLTSKLGRYRIFPIVGTLVLAFGLWLFSHLTLTTPEWMLGLWMLVIGAGLGTFMQIMTLAIQNSVDRRHMGTATSSATFFRSLGSAFGGAIFGSIMLNRLSHYLTLSLPHTSSKLNVSNIQQGANLQSLPPAVANTVQQSFVHAFHDMFLFAIPIALLAFVVALFLRETPLRSSHDQPVIE
ncbi:MAG TPA: MDR family MFS transporter [Candidatus Saccharimonadales bacterium]|jgi:EmrB/QacA subfamily drug resistance transporter|nr:MDR family MFS transporter [Candidatus Saccharimonadales bacterium]